VIGEVDPAGKPELSAADAYPMMGHNGSFEIRSQILSSADEVETPSTESVLVEQWQPTDEPDVWHVSLIDENSGDVLSDHRMIRRADGAVVVDSVVKHDRGLLVEMTPPKVVMPGTLRVGEEFVQDMRMRLPLIKDPSRVRASGTAQLRMSLLGTQRIRSAGGQIIRAVRTHEVFTTKLGPSRSERETDRWFVPGVGLVLEQWHERVTVLGVPIERTDRVLRRLDEPMQ